MLLPAVAKSGADYQNMDADLFMKSLQRRLLPALCREDGEEKIIPILEKSLYYRGVTDELKGLPEGDRVANAAMSPGLGVEHHGLHNGFVLPEVGIQFVRAPRSQSL